MTDVIIQAKFGEDLPRGFSSTGWSNTTFLIDVMNGPYNSVALPVM